MKKYSVIPMLLALSLGEAQATSLEDSIRRAIIQHPNIMAARADQKIANGEKREAFAGYFPQIEVGIDYNRTLTRPRAQESIYKSHSSQFISIRQILFSGFQTVYDNQAALLRKDAAQKNLSSTKSFTAITIVSYYFALLAAVLRDQYVYEALELTGKIMRETQARYTSCNRQGVSSAAAAASQGVEDCELLNPSFLEAQRRWLAYQSLRLNTLHDLSDSYNALNLQVNQTVDSKWEATSEQKYSLPATYALPTSAQLPKIPPNPETTLQAFRSRNPNLLAARKELEASHMDINSSRAEYMPRVEAYAYGERADFHNRDERVIYGTAGVRVTLPLDFGTTAGRIEQKEGKQQANSARLNSLILESEREIRRLFSIHNSSPRRIDILERSLLSNNDLVEQYQRKFFGKDKSFDVVYLLDAIDATYALQVELVSLRFQYVYTNYEIAHWAGDLTRHFGIE